MNIKQITKFGEKKLEMLIKKIPDISSLVTTAVLDTKIKEVDNEIPNLSGLVKKADYRTKISEIVGKYFTTPD